MFVISRNGAVKISNQEMVVDFQSVLWNQRITLRFSVVYKSIMGIPKYEDDAL